MFAVETTPKRVARRCSYANCRFGGIWNGWYSYALRYVRFSTGFEHTTWGA